MFNMEFLDPLEAEKFEKQKNVGSCIALRSYAQFLCLLSQAIPREEQALINT